MRALIISVVVVVLLVVGIDIGGRLIAESKASQAIAGQTSVAPKVSIHGFSFLAQALPGNYSHITLTSAGLTLGTVSGVNATVELYDVHYPMSDALHGSTDQLTAGRAELRATVALATLTRALNVPGVRLSAGSNGSVRLATTLTYGGVVVPVTADLIATLTGHALQLTTVNAAAAGVAVPAQVLSKVSGIALNLPLDGLPLQVTGASLTAVGTDAVIAASASNVKATDLR